MEMSMNCPHCIHRTGTEDRNNHLYYNTEKRVSFCHRCGYRGKGKIEIPSDYNYPKREWKEKLRNPEDLYDLITRDSRSLRVSCAKKYLLEHHIRPYTVAWRYRVKLDGMFMVFPVFSSKEMIYWQKRSLYEKRFFNQPMVPKPLFFTEEVSSDFVVVVESWTNAVRIAPFFRSVAIFGKYLDEDRAKKLVESENKILICLDHGEYHNSLKIERILRNLNRNVKTRSIEMPDERDLCDLSSKAVYELISKGANKLAGG